jgi:hypothetical protein
MENFFYFVSGIILAAAVAAAVFFAARHLRRRALFLSLQRSLFLVKIPRQAEGKEGGGERNFKTEIGKFEQLLANLASLKQPVVFEVAVPHIGEEILFYVSVPRPLSEVAAKQIQGIWSGASVIPETDDYNIFNPQGATAGAYLLQKENSALPIRTYVELESDTLAPILGGFAKVNQIGQGAAMQIVVAPAGKEFKKNLRGYIESLKKGEAAEKVFGREFPLKIGDLAGAFNPEKKEKEEKEKKERPVVDEAAVKSLEAKMSKPLFSVNVRILASAPTPLQAEEILDGLTAGFEQFASPSRNEFRVVKAKNPKKLVYQFAFRNFDSGKAMTLNSEEIASFYHFPISSTETPRVKWLKAKEAPPPANLPKAGTLLGRSVFQGEERPVYITDDDRRRHIYIIGQTGTGKSTLLGNMVIEDIRAGKGLAVIDPHGDLVQTVLGHIPKDRAEDLIYFDPGDLWRPLGLNMLEYSFNRPEEKTFIVNEMQGIFNKLFLAETMGPMFEQYMRNALLLLMEDMPNEPATLTEVSRVFTDAEYRRRKLARIKNPLVVDFWEKEAVKAGGEASLANMTPYITSKFNNFVANDYVRPIIGQPKSAFNFREVMDGGKILLINLSKGRVGDINAGLLGMVFTGKLLMAALSRVDVPQVEKRRDFNLYIDEFQNFTTDSISTILSEARKYRLNLTMAHQFIAQLNEKIRDSVFGNVGSQIVFRVGVQDAEFLVKQFAPVFDQNDLMSIDNMNAYAKLLINGETSKPFNIRVETTSWAKGDLELAESMKSLSRMKYGADREEVEAAIYKRLRE